MQPASNHRPPLTLVLAGNPNVGKSTIFNGLTGLNQHTGNWPGKTVECKTGIARYGGRDYRIVDTPGTYSLLPSSQEEAVTREFLCFGTYDCVLVVADATCLERSLQLALAVRELTPRMILCVNLADEARKKGICIDVAQLERSLGVPVALTTARSGRGIHRLLETADRLTERPVKPVPGLRYAAPLEEGVARLAALLRWQGPCRFSPRYLALRLLEEQPREDDFLSTAAVETGLRLWEDPIAGQAAALRKKIEEACQKPVAELVAEATVQAAEEACRAAVTLSCARSRREQKLDALLTGKALGIPLMLLLFFGILWITVAGANLPSSLLEQGLDHLLTLIRAGLTRLGIGAGILGLVCDGILGTLFQVIAVMLPPMAIFFPLFTLLEDAGYLPRIAFNLDSGFARAGTCGKQALTMCMGLGCNAVGVSGCRIIDSPRERLIAILTNSLVPCNGRFPAMITVSGLFFAGTGLLGSLQSALLVLSVVGLGVLLTLGTSRILSATLLKGVPSAFTLELPPFRRPQIWRVLYRSVLDRTLFVLGRAVAVAAPAGLVLWLMANLQVGDQSLLRLVGGILDPLGRLMGLDGYLLLAFFLGFPANEIVLPIALLCYAGGGSLSAVSGDPAGLLAANGWTGLTAVSFLLFSLSHFPCSTTCLTIHKETGSWKWTAVSFLLPLIAGFLLCTLTAAVWRIFQ